MDTLRTILIATVVLAWAWATVRFVCWLNRKRAEEFYGGRLGLSGILAMNWKYENNPASGAFSASREDYEHIVEGLAAGAPKKEIVQAARWAVRMLRGPRGKAIRAELEPALAADDETRIRKNLPDALKTIRGQVRLGKDAFGGLFQFGFYLALPAAGLIAGVLELLK